MERITSCRICDDTNLKEFLDLGKQPPANSLIAAADEQEAFYPLSLSWCSTCHLVQLNHTVAPKELFSNYFWVTATSKAAQQHAEVFYQEIISRVQDLKQGYVLEVASNDGTFLKPFVHNKYKVLGVDPAQNIVDIANKDGIPTMCRFFGEDTAQDIIKKHGKAKVIMVRNVLPHVANLHDVVQGLQLCLEDDGLLAIEFHYAKEIFEELHYDSIYHEHLCYFTLESVEYLLNSYQLYIHDIKKSPISGGSLVIYASKQKKPEQSVVEEYRKTEHNMRLNQLESWQQFASQVYAHREALQSMLQKVSKHQGKIVGYGASARSSTLLNFCGISSDMITKIADQNALKHDHFTAGTHIPIESPEKVMEEQPDYVFILAWNFTDEIVDILHNKFDYKGEYIIPLPHTPKIMRMDENNEDK